MKFNLLFTLLLSLLSFSAFSQTVVSGKVIDAKTKEALPFANVTTGTVGVVTDFDGNYTIEVENGTVELTFSYVGYENEVKEVNATGQAITLDVGMGSNITLVEIVIRDDNATFQKATGVFTNIPTKKLLEELGGDDISSVLTTVPGAQQTQQGGGDGDARISIRGFSQRNVAVMIDGVPVNDMENGWVYWSNWFGLDVATLDIQVQRGLGASKLSIPSVGGSMNIITKGIESKRQILLKQQLGNDGFTQTTLGLNSGKLKGDWSVTLAGSYKQGNGWVDQNYTQGGFYYAKINKQFKNHILTASAMGAPQNHGQRSFKAPIGIYDSAYAKDKLGMSDEQVFDQMAGFYRISEGQRENFTTADLEQGRRYNRHWGNYTKEDGELVSLNTKRNYYHKPQFTLRHTWDVSEKLYLSNIAYASIGNGGGTGIDGNIPTINNKDSIGSDLFGQLKLQTIYKVNSDFNQGRADNILRTSINNHRWYGVLSSFNYELTDRWMIKGGVDLRTYTGRHERKVYDLIGGTYFNVENGERNANEDPDKQLAVGDQYFYSNNGRVRWAGAFGLVEYDNDRWSVFANISGAVTTYSKVDFQLPKQLVLADTTFDIGYATEVEHEGVTYNRNSEGLAYQKTPWKAFGNFTFKGGVKYKFSKQQNVFANVGYLSKAPRFDNVIYLYNLDFIDDAKNETVQAFEIGYSYQSRKFSATVNSYHTNWLNKPLNTGDLPSKVDENEETLPANVNGIKALHQGIELDFAYEIIKKEKHGLAVEGLFSLGNWIWNSDAFVEYLNPDGTVHSDFSFDATGVHVGDAAQTQVGGLIRYEPIKGLYFKVKGTHYSRYFSNFEPSSLSDDYNPQFDQDGNEFDEVDLNRPSFDASGNEWETRTRRESWKIPAYTLFDVHTGYTHKFKNDMKLGIRINVKNVFDLHYISDAENNDTLNNGTSSRDFDAYSAGVFFGQGRRWTTSVQFTF